MTTQGELEKLTRRLPSQGHVANLKRGKLETLSTKKVRVIAKALGRIESTDGCQQKIEGKIEETISNLEEPIQEEPAEI